MQRATKLRIASNGKASLFIPFHILNDNFGKIHEKDGLILSKKGVVIFVLSFLISWLRFTEKAEKANVLLLFIHTQPTQHWVTFGLFNDWKYLTLTNYIMCIIIVSRCYQYLKIQFAKY